MENKEQNPNENKELNLNEMETAAGGNISELIQAVGMAWDIYNCTNNNHNYEWQGELVPEVHYNSPYYWQNKILICTKCGKKMVSTDYQIVGDIRVPNE